MDAPYPTRLSATPDDSPVLDESSGATPQRIGRYRIERVLGKGGFGVVYLAHDEQLHRSVAIKLPHASLVSQSAHVQAYLTEARTVANLDHPHIVPVYDVGSTDEYPCFIVSKYIDGTDLASRLQQSRLSIHDAAELVATVAEALHHAHKQGLVHRDIKPGNLLLDEQGKPFVADFGLALREQEVGRGPRYAGTPAYMSPEQARGEGHRVDGRSDIFSLGVVFYELLTHRRPFRGDSADELFEQIKSVEARPPRQIDDRIPKELERICLKALAKRASERYTTARDMAEDLRHFLSAPSAPEPLDSARREANGSATARSLSQPPPTPSNLYVGSIVPKGLRSFDAGDADFFLELLPGPRDRDGLPESIRFWKTRIETLDADSTFPVGLIYGPSGCGKSSLVKAGLLPRLCASAIALYVEATADDTEARLLKGLHRRIADLPPHFGLVESLTALRRGQYLRSGQKVLLVLDQFEQWLHAKSTEENAELVQALRQSDGARLQSILMVRDDFWMAATRFMARLEISLLQGQNCSAVDLFDQRHARKVLFAFGKAHGRLPENMGQCSREQDAFLEQALAGLAQEGKFVSVRLSLFAEMMKGRAWTPAALKEVGGTAGVGVRFLEDTFAAPSASPKHRLHQKAARAVLKALLPESKTDIKGPMRSYADLLAVSGYGNRPRDFDELMEILDREIRLLTPTDPEGKDEESSSPVEAGHKYYQLTHDYLVHSLRDWLTRKQKETRRGRAELLLADRSAVWNARPENRQLPSLVQWLQIRWLTSKKKWTPTEARMMQRASRHHLVRGLIVVGILALAGGWEYDREGRMQAHLIQEKLTGAYTSEVPGILHYLQDDMARYRRWLDPMLRETVKEAEANYEPRKQLHASLALLPVDAGQVEYLYGRLLEGEPSEVPVVRDALAGHKDRLVARLWQVAEKSNAAQRLHAAAALAAYDPDDVRWEHLNTRLVHDLVSENPVFLGQWSEVFRPIKSRLLAPLSAIYRDHHPERTAERSLATNLLAEYAADQPPVLSELLLDANEQQFAILFPKLQKHGESALVALTREVHRKLPADAPDDAKEKLAKRQANAGVALLRMDQSAKVWPLLVQRSDPRLRSYLIHRLSPLGADARIILAHLDDEPNLTIQRALILSLGEFPDKDVPANERGVAIRKLRQIYATVGDPGLHASAEWLLRQRHDEAWLRQTDEAWARDQDGRQRRLEAIRHTLLTDTEKTPGWYINSQAQTMVVIPGPVEFIMGSPVNEAGRSENEAQHRKRIGRTFAVSAKLVTKEQFLRFLPGFTHTEMRRYPDPACPIGGVQWYEAAAYCNWLSKQDGIPEDQRCYEMDRNGQVTGLKTRYLSLTGYRLPTEAEMEYATRAGSVTSRHYGETEDLLPKYAWYLGNSKEQTWPVGTLKPNDLGLFDVHGNVLTWCQETYWLYPDMKPGEMSADAEDDLAIVNTRDRVLRGGSFYLTASDVRSANRFNNVPTLHNNDVGFRPARTLVGESAPHAMKP